MEQTSIVIIGCGVVGLAVASALANDKKQVVVLERHESFGRETSSRNSEVIHAGIYYPTSSLKARLCVEGKRKLYQLCNRHNIPYRPVGKFIISNSEEESAKLFELYEQGIKNGVESLTIVSKEKLFQIEPDIRAILALYSPSSGIIDTHRLMKYLENDAQNKGALIGYNCTVKEIEKTSCGYQISYTNSEGQFEQLNCEVLINCAGLQADQIASMTGIDVEEAGYRLHPCKGEYFKVSSSYKGKISHLIYPAPTSISLGIHVVIDLNGNLKLGPNAFYISNISDYSVDPQHSQEFFDSAHRYLPFLKPQDLTPDMAGIRPKLQEPAEGFRDFVITEESARGFAGLINLVGIESPGLTASAAIGDYVAQLVKNL